MNRMQVETVLADYGFVYNEKEKEYHIPDYERICASFNDKDDRGYYNGKFDDTCFFNIYDNNNEIEVPIEHIKYIKISKDNELKTINVSIDTKTGIFITTLFKSKCISLCNLKYDLEYAANRLNEGLSAINDIVKNIGK